jgi:hypothetical protein
MRELYLLARPDGRFETYSGSFGFCKEPRTPGVSGKHRDFCLAGGKREVAVLQRVMLVWASRSTRTTVPSTALTSSARTSLQSHM